jgi:hypothetical protein
MIQNLRCLDVTERRSKTRFPIELVARYAVPGRLEIEATGRTVNISSHGVLMTYTSSVSPGTPISVMMEWPIFLSNACPLALHIRGTVVRSDRGLIAVRFSTHEFRTKPKPPDCVAEDVPVLLSDAQDFAALLGRLPTRHPNPQSQRW